ncbi:MAG: hypothetical protein ABSA71_06370 [Desulfomonilia bacterium]|jgi:hypothetical protein
MLNKSILIIIVPFLFLLFWGCDQSSRKIIDDNNSISEPTQKTFNIKDKMTLSNGNLVVAAMKLTSQKPDTVWQHAEDITAAILTKNPYSSLGKLFKISGKIYRVEELPPDFGLSGHWSEISMLTPNRNAPLDATNISFIFNGDVTNINAGHTITCAGYYAGNYESQNAMGGTLEALVIVGNTCKPYKRHPVIPEEYSPRK